MQRLHFLHLYFWPNSLLKLRHDLLFTEVRLREVIRVEISYVALEDSVDLIRKQVKLLLFAHFQTWVDVCGYLRKQVLFILFILLFRGHLRVVGFLLV